MEIGPVRSRKMTYLVAWRLPETGQVKKGRMSFASEGLAEYTVKTLNRTHPDVEYWIMKVEEAVLPAK
jgi:hypothetical protein